ncbi:MAG: hypothetical protein GY772_28940 [bacterium]|nr:hypothetical protein [bacterium]
MYRAPQTCDTNDCRTCEPRVRSKRGERAYERYGGAGIAGAVFTLPDDWCEQLTPHRVRGLRRELAKMIVSWWQARGLLVGLRIAAHPCGDICHACGWSPRGDQEGLGALGACPNCGEPARWRPHFHVTWPLVGLRAPNHRPHWSPGDVVRLPAFMDKSEIESLRAWWRRLLVRISEVRGAPEPPPEVVIHYAYKHAHEREKVQHRLSYDLRPFPSWSAGDGWGTLARATSHGLLAPSSRAQGLCACEPGTGHGDECPLALWRERIRGPVREKDSGPQCPCCEEPQPMILLDLCFEWSRKGLLIFKHSTELARNP